MMAQDHRLVLGTVQLGMSYGIANSTGQPDLKTAEKIVRTALDNGIYEFDTAQAYGTSENVLGTVLRKLGMNHTVRIVSKLHPDTWENCHKHLENTLKQSLIRLGVNRLYGLMLHEENLLDLWDKGLGEALLGFVRQGLIDHLGVSVYSPVRACQALHLQGIHLVQVPSNMLDRRFENAGVYNLAIEKQKSVYVRSIFLQGLLLSKTSHLNQSMAFAYDVLEMLSAITKEWGISAHELSIGYVKHAYPEAKILFGAETPEQVQMNVFAWHRIFPEEYLQQIRNTFSNVDETILNPGCWPK